MNRALFAQVIFLAVLGLVIAAGIGFLTNSIAGDSIGLSATPLSAGRDLAPAEAKRGADRRQEQRQRRQDRRQQQRERRLNRLKDAQTTTTTVPTTTVPTTTVPTTTGDDNSGSGSSSSGSGSDDFDDD
ncbi:MAG: hypothetical protein ABI726_00535 [bacterium]